MQDLLTFDIGLHQVCVRTGVRYVITKFSGMDSLPNFLTHGAPLRAREARAGAPLSRWRSGDRSDRLLLRVIANISDIFALKLSFFFCFVTFMNLLWINCVLVLFLSIVVY